MSRDYFIDDASGQRRIDEAALPLAIGGKNHAGIVLANIEAEQIFAYIALSDGHAYLQATEKEAVIFLNHEKLVDSSWLKSGDQIQIGNNLINWTVRGDKVLIDVSYKTQQADLRAPQSPPPAPALADSNHNEMPIHAPEAGHSNHSQQRRLAGYVSAALLILSALYLLMSTPVIIQIDPVADTLKLQGFPPPVTLWGSRLALPGQYTVEAKRKGYAPLKEQITIHPGKSATFDYELKELPGYLKITSTPEMAIGLFVDGSEAGFDASGLAAIPRGTHQILIEAERYLPHSQTIEISGYGQTQQLEIQFKPAWASTTISSIPDKANIRIDGKLMGTTTLVSDILEGKHEIALDLEGFKPAKRMLEFIAGTDVSLEPFELVPSDGHLVINSQPAGASIRIDDAFRGVTPLELQLTSNIEHRIQASKSGHISKELQIELKPEASRVLNITLEPEHGIIFLSTTPADASLLIDGKPAASPSGRFRLSSRPHAIKLSKPGYVTQTVTVTPNQGSSQNIVIQLKTEQQQVAQKKAAANPAIITTGAGQALHLIKPDTHLKMGASRREAGRRANESRRLVALDRHFYFSSNEISNREYRQFQSVHDSGSMDGARLNDELQPVVNISWDDAARYCNWLSKQQGLPEAYVEKNNTMLAAQPMNTGYRLPTEAEWAWVARHQGQAQLQKYPWLGRFPPKTVVGNYADAQIADTLADVIPEYDDGFRGTAPIGSFKANPEGYYDIGGNVAEWVHDYYALYPGVANKLSTNPTGPASGTHHVVRGAGWRHGSITELRSSYRDYSSKPRYDLGFRIARYAE